MAPCGLQRRLGVVIRYVENVGATGPKLHAGALFAHYAATMIFSAQWRRGHRRTLQPAQTTKTTRTRRRRTTTKQKTLATQRRQRRNVDGRKTRRERRQWRQ